MSGQRKRWLTIGLFASAGTALLCLTSILQSAFAFGDETALIMGPSGIPVPPPSFVDAANDLYLHLPAGSAYPLTTPEGLYPITGVNTLRLDPSLTQGEATLYDAITQQINDHNHVDVFGWSQSSTLSSLEMSQLAANNISPSDVSFTLVGDPSNPAGGMLERFAGAYIPTLGVTASGATPSDLYPTDIYTNEYDGFADFPRYPINFLSDLNAYLGIAFEHVTYLDPTPGSDVVDLGTFDDTTYYMNVAEDLPLLEPLRWLPFGNPLADLLQPDMSVLVNLGYGNITQGWDPGPPDSPNPFELFPTNINWTDVLTALINGIPQGITKAVQDIESGQLTDLSSLQQLADAAHTAGLTPSDEPSLGELLAAVATYANGDVPITPIDWSSPTSIIDGLTGLVSTESGVLQPTADIVSAVAVTLPSYDATLFLDNLEAGNLLAAFGDPIAADIGLLPLPIAFEAGVIGEALATTAYQLFGSLIP